MLRHRPGHVGRESTLEGETQMKRREFLKSAGVGLAASTAVAAPAIAQSMPEIKWRMPTSWPKSLDTLYGGREHFPQRGAAMRDGKIQIQGFSPPGSGPRPPGGDAGPDGPGGVRHNTCHCYLWLYGAL